MGHRSNFTQRHFVHEVYLHECDEQEEGVGCPPDLLIQETGQKGEHPVLGGTAAEDKKREDIFFFLTHYQEGRKHPNMVCR